MTTLTLKELKEIPLLKCPCCGGDAKLFENQVRGGPEMCNALGVMCTKCFLQVAVEDYLGHKTAERLEESINKWNSRV